MADGYLAVANSSASDDWPTPSWVVRQAEKEFCGGRRFDTDPATNPDNPVGASVWYTPLDDGLTQEWKGRVWLNPPYGRTIGQWMDKAHNSVSTGSADLVVCLVPVRVDARWWRRNIIFAETEPLVRFWPKRLRYVDQDAPFASATIVYGWRSTGKRHGTVAKECPVCGEIFWPNSGRQIVCSVVCRKTKHRHS